MILAMRAWLLSVAFHFKTSALHTRQNKTSPPPHLSACIVVGTAAKVVVVVAGAGALTALAAAGDFGSGSSRVQ